MKKKETFFTLRERKEIYRLLEVAYKAIPIKEESKYFTVNIQIGEETYNISRSGFCLTSNGIIFLLYPKKGTKIRNHFNASAGAINFSNLQFVLPELWYVYLNSDYYKNRYPKNVGSHDVVPLWWFDEKNVCGRLDLIITVNKLLKQTNDEN